MLNIGIGVRIISKNWGVNICKIASHHFMYWLSSNFCSLFSSSFFSVTLTGALCLFFMFGPNPSFKQ